MQDPIENMKKAYKAQQKALGINKPTVSFPKPHFPEIHIPPNPIVENVKANRASEFHSRLLKWISEFDASLDQSYEVGVRLVSFGQTVVFHLEQIGYWNPSLITFKGYTEDGDPVELIQHVSQISVLLTKLPRKDISKPKKPIGFTSEIVEEENVQDSDEC